MPPRHYIALIVGIMITSGSAFLAEHASAEPGTRSALGASGIVSGLVMANTMLAPWSKITLFGFISATMWKATVGFCAVDLLLLGRDTEIGHSSHLSCAAFGAVYYALFLRKFGGVLNRTGRIIY